jgi:hypothetical protein
MDRYFASELYGDLAQARARIRAYANDKYSWATVARVTVAVYQDIVSSPARRA